MKQWNVKIIITILLIMKSIDMSVHLTYLFFEQKWILNKQVFIYNTSLYHTHVPDSVGGNSNEAVELQVLTFEQVFVLLAHSQRFFVDQLNNQNRRDQRVVKLQWITY